MSLLCIANCRLPMYGARQKDELFDIVELV